MAITDRKQREKEQRRNSIITAAERLFYSRGYDNVSMDDIAQEAELSKGALYFYFKKKDSLFFAIVSRKQTELVDHMAERLKDEATGGEKLRAIIECSVDFTKKNPEYNDMACTFGPVIMSRMDGDDEKLFAEKTNEYNALLFDAIKEGREDGTIRKDLDAVLMGFYITLITISVVSPLPTWKKAFALSGISFHQFLDSYSCFIDPAISKCPEEYGESSRSS
jgi:TetR/AcrR family transcriptional regulator